MSAVLIALLAQFCVTSADAFVKTRAHLFKLNLLHRWVFRYAATRYAGLCLRLFALFTLPVAGAATLFSASAISVSSAVALKQGEVMTDREKFAVLLILAAVLIRSL